MGKVEVVPFSKFVTAFPILASKTAVICPKVVSADQKVLLLMYPQDRTMDGVVPKKSGPDIRLPRLQ